MQGLSMSYLAINSFSDHICAMQRYSEAVTLARKDLQRTKVAEEAIRIHEELQTISDKEHSLNSINREFLDDIKSYQ